jgi:hypothetical protein
MVDFLIRNEFITQVMKPLYASVLAILVTVTIVGMLTISSQQVFAPRGCDGCSEFKKLTHEFEKDVTDAAIGDPGIIPELVHDYSDKVLDLFRTPSTSP